MSSARGTDAIIAAAALLREAERPIRVLRTVAWPSSVKDQFFADACQRLPEVEYPRVDRAPTLEIIDRQQKSNFFDIGPHPPRLWPEDIGRLHELWLKLTRDRFGARLHHRDVVSVALM